MSWSGSATAWLSLGLHEPLHPLSIKAFRVAACLATKQCFYKKKSRGQPSGECSRRQRTRAAYLARSSSRSLPAPASASSWTSKK